MLPKKLWIPFGLIAAGAVLLFAYWEFILRRGELGDKEAYAVLQGLEIKYRSEVPSEEYIIVTGALQSEYDAMGVPTGDAAQPLAWIILNRLSSEGKVMVIPVDSRISLRCARIETLPGNLGPEIRDFLTRRCQQ